MTADLVKRVFQHNTKNIPGFTSKYNVTFLLHYEVYDDIVAAIVREKKIKKGDRAWKLKLIEKENPMGRDLYESL